eukprot:9496200-Pyramimonas_sp.AAC.1
MDGCSRDAARAHSKDERCSKADYPSIPAPSAHPWRLSLASPRSKTLTRPSNACAFSVCILLTVETHAKKHPACLQGAL